MASSFMTRLLGSVRSAAPSAPRSAEEAFDLTADALAGLHGDGAWHVVHRLVHGRGVIDHVVVGPPGVMLISDGGAPLNGLMAGSIAEQEAVRRTALFCERLQAFGIKALWVKCAVVNWDGKPAGDPRGDKVMYLHGAQLVDWLRTLPQKLEPIQAETVAGIIASFETSDSPSAPRAAGGHT